MSCPLLEFRTRIRTSDVRTAWHQSPADADTDEVAQCGLLLCCDELPTLDETHKADCRSTFVCRLLKLNLSGQGITETIKDFWRPRA